MSTSFPARHRSPSSQRGITLLIALIFLLVLSMLGIWGMTTNSLQERMAGNTRNRDLAFQAAEAALDYAENTLTTWRTGDFDGTDGLLAYDITRANDAIYWRNTDNWASYRQVPVGNLNQVAEQPRFVIEKIKTEGKVEYYRITARGVGGHSSAVAILQTIVTYTP
jgi:type IV pilus assembly protein PilX